MRDKLTNPEKAGKQAAENGLKTLSNGDSRAGLFCPEMIGGYRGLNGIF